MPAGTPWFASFEAVGRGVGRTRAQGPHLGRVPLRGEPGFRNGACSGGLRPRIRILAGRRGCGGIGRFPLLEGVCAPPEEKALAGSNTAHRTRKATQIAPILPRNNGGTSGATVKTSGCLRPPVSVPGADTRWFMPAQGRPFLTVQSDRRRTLAGNEIASKRRGMPHPDTDGGPSNACMRVHGQAVMRNKCSRHMEHVDAWLI